MRALRIISALLSALVGVAFVIAASGAQQANAPTSPDAVRLVLDSLGHDPNGVALTGAELTDGARTVGAREHITGNVASWHGPLEIDGIVDGNAVAIGGDVTIKKGGRVRGDAVSVGGTVHLDGGTVDGETRTISAITVGRAHRQPLTPRQAIGRSVSLSVAWYLVLAFIGLGVLVVARPNLFAVADALRAHGGRAFAIGLAGELGLAPAFTLVIVALAITIIGIIAVPFAVPILIAAIAGALALGFLAIALITGQALTGDRNGADSLIASLQPLLLGLSLFLVVWVLGTAFLWTGGLGIALRALAALITWIAVTAGFGAVIITRAGTRAAAQPAQLAPAPTAEHEWQTPTPVSGVAAARRPTPAPRRGASDR